MSLLITTAKLMEIIEEEIEEALDPHRSLAAQAGDEYEEPEGDLPGGLPLASPAPCKQEPDPYPLYPSARAMMLAMGWYRHERPKKYKNFIKDKGTRAELDQINRSTMAAAREIDAARQTPPSAYDAVHDVETEIEVEVAEGVILHKYIKEELEAYLAEKKKYKKSFYKAKEKKADELMASGTDEDAAYGIADTIVSKQGKKKKKSKRKKK